jgi:Kef-type K+ transport system membrane component KefB
VGEALLVAQIVLLLLLLVVGRGLGKMMQRLGQPAVIGPVLAGLILGPSGSARRATFHLPHPRRAAKPAHRPRRYHLDHAPAAAVLHEVGRSQADLLVIGDTISALAERWPGDMVILAS